MLRYRPNVAFILSKQDGRILVCERRDVPGCWQFPQGGVKAGESRLDALHREVREEISLKPEHYSILNCRGPYRYLFMEGKARPGYEGQEQHYYLATLISPEFMEHLDPDTKEFRAAKWIAPREFRLKWVPPMKHEVYRQVFRDFFAVGLSLPGASGEKAGEESY